MAEQQFALAQEEQVFIIKEDTPGVFKKPSVNNRVLCVGLITTSQETEFLEDAQIRGFSRSRFSFLKGRRNPGTWSCRTYIKPSGTKGTAPEADVFFECLMGQKTTVPNTSVTYSLISTQLPSFSMIRVVGPTTFFISGGTVNAAEFTISGGELGGITWSGQFMNLVFAGTTTATEAVSNGATSVVVDDIDSFFGIGSYIVLGEDTNNGAGYRITNINYSTSTLTFTPSAVSGCDAGDVIKGWYPTGSWAELGAPVHGKLGLATIEGTPAIILGATITITNNIKYYLETKNGYLYPTSYGAVGYRDVGGTLRLFFYTDATKFFTKSENIETEALVIPAGDTAGSIMELQLPNVQYLTPGLGGTEEIVLEIPIRALGSSGDDEISIVFK